jgi:hypothetical protein
MSVIEIIILSLFVLLWVVPLIYWHFTATPKEKEKFKTELKNARPIKQNDFRYSVLFLNYDS